ncbi:MULTISPECIES: LysR family transcriptional regulator [Gemella]|nr:MULTISPECIES: LysR family transcriptional regulator [Gemella]
MKTKENIKMFYEQIETFLTTVTYGSISAAAKYLYVSQSTVSSRLQQLENELGVQLLIRNKGHRRVELTNYGHSFIPIASQWASLWKDTQHLKDIENIQTLTIASVDAVNNYTFVSFFKKFMSTHPNIRLNIRTHHSSEIYSLVEDRIADIGFVFSRINYPDVVSKPIYRELMYLICSKNSPYHNDMDCGELPTEKEVLLNWGLDYKSWHDLHFNPSCHPALSINTGSMLQRYIQDDSWGVAPMSVINGAMRSNPNLTFFTLTTPPPPRICYIIRNPYPNVNNSKLIEEFEQELTSFISDDENICSFENWMLND